MSDAGIVADHPSGSSAALWGARGLLALLAVVTIGGSIYFSFFASEADGGATNAIDYALGVWAFGTGIGFLATALLLDRGPHMVRLARIVIYAYLLFSAIKIVGYGETEVVGMVAVALLILVLLHIGTRSRK